MCFAIWPLCPYCLHSWINTAVSLFLHKKPRQMLLHLGEKRPRLLWVEGTEATSQYEQTQTQQPQPVTQPNGILEFLKRPVSGSATTAYSRRLGSFAWKTQTLASTGESFSHSWKTWQMMTAEAYATRRPCSLAQGGEWVILLDPYLYLFEFFKNVVCRHACEGLCTRSCL